VLYYIQVAKFVKLTNFNIFEDFIVLLNFKITKFVKIAYIVIMEDFRVLYTTLKSRSWLNLQILVFWNIFVCYTS